MQPHHEIDPTRFAIALSILLTLLGVTFSVLLVALFR